MVERESLALVGRGVAPFELECLRIDEDAAGVDHLHVAPLGQLCQAAGEGVDHLFLAGPHGVDVELQLAEADAPFAHVAGLADHLGHMQQGLGRNAPAQQASPPQSGIGLDDGDLHPQVGGHKRRRIPPGTTS